MCDYGVCDANLERLLDVLRSRKDVHGAKISGSGLGDCVVAVGQIDEAASIPFRHIPVAFDPEGIIVELK
jgi:mevalonate kinase